MALSAVQAISLTSDASSANVSVNATAGNALIVGGNAYTGNQASGNWTVTRTGDTYTTDVQVQSAGAADHHRNGIASAPNVAGGAVTLSIAVTNALAIDAWALEISGPPSSGIRDANSPAGLTGNDASAETNSLSNVTASAIFVAVVGSESGTNPATVTEPSGYTITVGGTTMKRTNGSADQVGGMAFKIVAATGAETPTWTVTSSQWSTTIAVYKDAGGGGGPTPVEPLRQRTMLGAGV